MDKELIGKWINVILIVGTVIGIIYPALLDDTTTFAQIIRSLFEPPLNLAWASRWLVVAVFIGSAYAFVVGMLYRKVPITILTSKIELKYLDRDGNKVAINRSQTLRANQRKVTAFISTHRPSTPSGRVPKADIEVNAFGTLGDLDGRKEIYGQENQSIEVIQIFNKPLPYAWFMPLVPIGLLGSDFDNVPRPFRKFIVSRSSTVVYQNEFTGDKVMQFTADNYPSHNAVVTLDFTASDLPVRAKISAMRIKNQGVVELPFEYRQADKKVVFRIDRLENERLRISWG